MTDKENSDFLEDKLHNNDYWLALYALDHLQNNCWEVEAYELAETVDQSWYRISQDYIDFRLNRSQYYQSEGRKVIKEVYKILNYNPYNPKQIK